MTSSRVLQVLSSPRRGDSESGRVADALVERYAEMHPGAEVDRLDLWAEPLPAFDGTAVTAKMAVIGGGRPPSEARAAWDAVEAAARRLLAADRVVLAAPVWNGGVPWVLKHWIDTVTQPGLLFRFDPDSGYHGLAGGRRAVVVAASSVYAHGRPPAFGRDFHLSYLTDWLTFVGIDVHATVPLWRTRPDDTLAARRADAIAAARRAAEVF